MLKLINGQRIQNIQFVIFKLYRFVVLIYYHNSFVGPLTLNLNILNFA